jgi:cobalt-zinc-cadmium efflux system outer membrane protein
MGREAMTTVTFPLEPLYQRGPRVRRADADVRAAEAEAAGTSLRVMVDASHAYYQTALAQVEVDAARDVATWLDTIVAYNRARVKEGVAAEADLLRSEVERDRAAADATMQEADLFRSRALLATFLGDTDPNEPAITPAVHVVVDDAPLIMPAIAAPTTLLAAPSQPRVQAARERVVSASAGITSERSMLLRQLGATVGTKGSDGTTSLIAGVSLPFPLFDQNRGEVARATAERDAAAFELAAMERDARAELSGALGAARLLTDRASTLSARGADGRPTYLARADEARRIALGAYREGAVPLLSVIDASRAWGEARIAYYRTLFAQHESVILLLAAQGVDIGGALPSAMRGPSR